MIRQALETAFYQALSTLNLPGNPSINVERPREASFGDYAINISPLAKFAKQPPPVIAARLVEGLESSAWSTSVAGAFINFQIAESQLIESLVQLVHEKNPGQNQSLQDMHCLLEFVSANPTGPLHIGHGRWVALGDSLARIFTHCGAMVTREFYINDAGVQMFNIANSLRYRLMGDGQLPAPIEGEPYPFYPGEYVIELAQKYPDPDNLTHEALAAFAKTEMLQSQKALMERCRLTFDVWFSEQSLHDAGAVIEIVEKLKNHGVTYEKDGALWFATTRFGDDQDRVLIKSDGSYTYLTADIAYFENKSLRENRFYNRFIYIWGADHHGYIPRMKAAVCALGYDPEQFEVTLGQLVNLIIDGEKTRMGKRKKMLTLEELVDEVGVDAVRFWMISKSQDTALDFNVELAASSSDENPVFYVQYAHARCASILRNAFQPRLDTINNTEQLPLLKESDWQKFMADLKPDQIYTLFASLENDQAKTALRALILKLDSFEDVIMLAAKNRTPHLLARYTQDLASDFHHFYTVCRVLVPDPDQAKSRLVVIYALKKVLAQALDLLGVSAPEQM